MANDMPQCSPDIQVFREINRLRKNLTDEFYDACGEMCEAECDLYFVFFSFKWI